MIATQSTIAMTTAECGVQAQYRLAQLCHSGLKRWLLRTRRKRD